MAIEDTRGDYILSLRYELLVGNAYTALGTLALAAGLWGGSRFTIGHPQRDTLYPHSVQEGARPRVAGLENRVADRDPKSEYTPFIFVKIDNHFFAVIVAQTGAINAGSSISEPGFGDVYDRKGRLVRRYVAVEDTNSSWEFIEFMRLPRSGPRSLPHEEYFTKPIARSQAQIVAEQEIGGR
jgi:hypothetical protein